MRSSLVTSIALSALVLSAAASAADRTYDLTPFPNDPAWDEEVAAITAALPQGGQAIPMKSTGTVFVSGVDDGTLKMVGHLVAEMNRKASITYSVEARIFRNGKLETTLPMVTTGRRPTPVELITEQDYVQNYAADGTPNVGKLRYGLIFGTEVRQLDDGHLNLHYALHRSDLLSLTSVTGPHGNYQVPDMDKEDADETVIVDSGKVISGKFGKTKGGDMLTYTISASVMPPAVQSN